MFNECELRRIVLAGSPPIAEKQILIAKALCRRLTTASRSQGQPSVSSHSACVSARPGRSL
jgi:hypothetical protein